MACSMFVTWNQYGVFTGVDLEREMDIFYSNRSIRTMNNVICVIVFISYEKTRGIQ